MQGTGRPRFHLTLRRQGERHLVALDTGSPLVHESEVYVDETRVRGLLGHLARVTSGRTQPRAVEAADDPHARSPASLTARRLQAIGEQLFSQLLPPQAGALLRNAAPADLFLHLEEELLLHVPWELCHDGREFLATKFSLGRSIHVPRPIPVPRWEPIEPGRLRVLLIADPTESLPQAVHEAEQLCRLLDVIPAVKVTLLGGKLVHKDEVLLELQAHDIVHFAGHSHYDPAQPHRSGWHVQDGLLTAEELRTLSRSPLLVFSNSCQAGATTAWGGRYQYDGEAFGIGSAFLAAGVRHYLGTFWVVHDEESREFAVAFYKSLASGFTLGEALRQTRLEMRAQHGGERLTWASYMLYGDPTVTILPAHAPPADAPGTGTQPVGGMQRKLAALLSADVQGYSRLMGADEEATIRTLTVYRTVMTSLIQQYRGRVVDAPGDNLLAEFASAVEAVQCAVAIQHQLTDRNAKLPARRRMVFRIGINLGDVVVDGEQLYGDGVNIAARLEGLAHGGGICISGAVYDQIETKLALHYESLGERMVKNIAKPVRVYRVRLEGEEAATPPAPHAAESAQAHRAIPEPLLLGRERELAQLQQGLVRALQGEQQVVFVTGEAGIGKTTLVDVFLRRAAASGEFWFGQGQCIEHYGAGEAYLPVLTALGQLCRTPEGQRLREVLSQHAPTWLVQLPALLSAADVDALQRKTQGATRERMLRELAEAVEVLTMEQPLVLWLEDLHWSDPSTLDLLALLARRRQPARLLVIGTARSVDGHTHPLYMVKQELHLHGQCNEVALGLLSETQVVEYLAVRFDADVGARRTVPLQQAARLIHRRTEGNPLFMINLVEDLVAQGAIVHREGKWELPKSLEEVGVGVPENLRQLIEMQLARLTAEEQRVVEVGSVAGVAFSAAAVAAGLATDVGEVEECCEGLARREQLLRARETEEWPDGTVVARYGFLHALYQEVVYARLTARRRGEAHRRIGERIEQGYGKKAREVAAELAVHFEQGRDYPKAVQYLQQAGENAVQRSAHQEAITLLTRGLELLKTLPDTPERTQRELRLQIALGTPLSMIKGYAAPELEHAYTRAQELCQQIGENPLLFNTLSGLCSVYRNQAKLPLALELAEQLLGIAKRTQDPRQLVWAHQALGFTFHELGEFILARIHLEEAIALYDPKQGLHGWVADPRVGCLSYVSDVLWSLGYPDQALKRSQEAVVLARELPHPYSLSFALAMASGVHWRRGEQQASRETYKESAAIAREQSFGDWFGLNPLLEGAEQTRQGKQIEGITRIRQGLATFRAMGKELGRPFSLFVLAEAYGQTGQVKEGLNTLEDALKLVHKAGERRYEAELYRFKGELTLQSRVESLESRVTEAEGCFQQAIELARCQEAKSLELRATISLARLWQSQGKTDKARKMLAEIYGWFTEGFDTKDLQEAKALLDMLEGQTVERRVKKHNPKRREPEQSTKQKPKQQRSATVRRETEAPAPDARREQGPTLALPAKPSIAVLPFVNMSGDPEQEYFSDGLTEDVITDLAQLSGVFVIARNSSFSYKGTRVQVQEVGRTLGVRYVLEGSVRKAADRVRITAQLVDAATGHHVWAERYDRELHDLFTLQDEIIRAIVSNIGAEIRQAELERVRRTPTANLTAYDYFLRGWESFWRLTRETNQQAQQLWEQAVALDSQYAEAYAWLGWSHFLEWAFQWTQDPQILERILVLAQQALALDDSSSKAYRVLSQAYLWKRQHEQALAAGKRAIALSPNDAMNYLCTAEILNFTGRPEEALGMVEQAMRLDPRQQERYLFQAGMAMFLLGRLEKARAILKRFLTSSPNHLAGHLLMAAILILLGQEEAAQVEAAEVRRINPQYSLEVLHQTLPITDPAGLEHALGLLRKAGLT